MPESWKYKKHHTEEAKRKISQALIGIKNPRYGKPAWNKGLKGLWGANSGSFKEGEHRSPATEFKKGQWAKEKHWNWKGGIYYRPCEHNKTKEYIKWRKAVFERDNYTCQYCDKKGIYLHPHHIKSWSKYPELRFDINNGITLCKECHKKIR